MNKKNLIELILKFIVIIVLLILIIMKVKNLAPDKTKKIEVAPGVYTDNVDDIYNSEYKTNGLVFREISYLYDFNTGSTFNIKIINNNSNIYSLHGFTANIYDKKNNLLKKIDIDLRADIGSGDSINYSFDIEGDVIGTQAYKIVYKPN